MANAHRQPPTPPQDANGGGPLRFGLGKPLPPNLRRQEPRVLLESPPGLPPATNQKPFPDIQRQHDVVGCTPHARQSPAIPDQGASKGSQRGKDWPSRHQIRPSTSS
nr:hypothetical protein [uncultured bacterium]